MRVLLDWSMPVFGSGHQNTEIETAVVRAVVRISVSKLLKSINLLQFYVFVVGTSIIVY